MVPTAEAARWMQAGNLATQPSRATAFAAHALVHKAFLATVDPQICCNDNALV
jgi:hypothetical protein